MVLAQKRAESQVSYEKVERQGKKVREVVVTRRRALRKLKAIAAVLLIFAVSLLIIYRYSFINEKNLKIGKLKAEMSLVQKNNSQLRVELDKKVDLTLIEQLAVERLGMQYPEKSQMIYVQLDKKDFTEVPETGSDSEKKNDVGVWGTLAQGITELAKYLY